MLTLEQKTQAIIDALEDIKAVNIAVIDTHRRSSLFDCMVIASAQSTRQTKALADNVEDKLKELGEAIIGREGDDTGEWILVDFGEVVVHIMQPAIRDYYNLEELWSKTPATVRPKLASAAK